MAESAEKECKTMEQITEEECKAMLESTEKECKTILESAEKECKTMAQILKEECKAMLESAAKECKTISENVDMVCKTISESGECKTIPGSAGQECKFMAQIIGAGCKAMLESTEKDCQTISGSAGKECKTMAQIIEEECKTMGVSFPATSMMTFDFGGNFQKWDPTLSVDWSKETPSPRCIPRIKRDLMSIYKDPLPGMFIVAEEKDLTLIHALLLGPFDTPYEGGFFYFVMRCPPDYPLHPPRVKLMTTGEGTVRFNPNLYKNGKVCLSILGTWSGPSWRPTQSVSSVLLSIQSLMCENPYYNEPGFDRERTPGAVRAYNKIITHETIRVAVCDMLEGATCDSKNCPQPLKEAMEKLFPDFFEYYSSVCKKYIDIGEEPMVDPFGEARHNFDYRSLLQRLQAIKEKLDAKVTPETVPDVTPPSKGLGSS